MELGVKILTPEKQAEQREQLESQFKEKERILREKLNALGVSRFLKGILTAHNAVVKPAGNPGVWKETDIFHYPHDIVLRKNLLRISTVRKTRSFPDGHRREEKVALEFPILEEDQPPTVTIIGEHMTYSGGIPDMNDASGREKGGQREFIDSIRRAMLYPRITQD